MRWILILLLSASLNAQQTAEAAAQTVSVAKSNNWQNWTFAVSAVVTAATAIFVVSIDNGNRVQSTTH